MRNRDTPASLFLDELLEEGDACLASVILQELLQGARCESALNLLHEQFSGLPILIASWITYPDTGALYTRCRWKGITPRSPHDCLIAQLAIENDVALLQ